MIYLYFDIIVIFVCFCVFEKNKKEKKNEFMMKNDDIYVEKQKYGFDVWDDDDDMKFEWKREMKYILCSMCFMMFMNCHVSHFQNPFMFL